MDKIKSLLSSGNKKDETTYDSGSGQQAGASGKVTGEGSHFGAGETGTLGSRAMGTTDSSEYAGGSTPSNAHMFGEKGPLTSGETGTRDSEEYAGGNTPANAHMFGERGPSSSGAPGTTESSEYPGGNTPSSAHMFGETPGHSAREGSSGQAAIGQTSTYSSHPLSTGQKTSSVVDPSSSDPTTFRKPESSSTGVQPGAAQTAARRAYTDNMPGGFPEDSSNPYASSTLDPRVDSPGHAPAPRQSHTGRDAALGTGAGAAGLGTYESTRHREPTSSTQAPSTLTGTTDPAQSSAYGSAGQSRGLDSATPATGSSYSPAATSTSANTTDSPSTEKKGMVGSVLGALGIGGAAAAAKKDHDQDSAVESTPSTTTGVGSYSTPSQSGPPPSHHRKESIPTTAYPSGNLDSVKPIAGPTGQAPTQTESDNHYGRDAAIGGGALGASGLGAHEYEKSREPTTGTTGTSSGAAGTASFYDSVTSGSPQASEPSGTTSTIPQYSQSTGTGTGTGTGSGTGTGLAATAGTTDAVVPGATSSTMRTAGDESRHHYGRDAAIGGGALGAAGLGAHEYEQSRAPTSGTSGSADQYQSQPYSSQGASGVTSTSQHYGNQPITQGNTQSFNERVDPRTDAAGNAKERAGEGVFPASTSEQAEDKHHYGRDAAFVGGGAAAAGVGAHEYSEHDAGNAENQHAKLQKSRTKEMEKEQKAHEKEIKKEQKAEEKAERKHEKEIEKEEKAHEKALEKEHSRHEKEGAAAVGAGAVGTGGAYEYEKHQQSSAGTSGGGAYGAERQYESSQTPTTANTSGATQSAEDPYHNRQPVASSAVEGSAIGGSHGTPRLNDPYYARKHAPASAAAEQQTQEPHYGRDAAVGGAGAAAVGGGAYEAEKHHGEHEETKKPSLLKRIFGRKKNEHGEEVDDEDNYQDVPHEHAGQGETSAAGVSDAPHDTHEHVEGEMAKPSYNPFKKEVASDYGAVEGRI